MDSEQTTFSLRQFLDVIRRRGLWIVLCFVLAAIVAYGLSKHQHKKYTAVAAVTFNNNQLNAVIGLGSSFSSNEAAAKQKANLELVKLGNIAAKTARTLGHGVTAEAVNSSLSITAQGETNVIAISAISTSPGLAAEIANTYAREFVAAQQSANRRFLSSALALVNRQLARLSPGQRFGSDGLDLQQRAHTLSLLAGLGYNTVSLAQEAVIPGTPSSPKTKQNTILGAALGLLAGLLIALLLERSDNRIRRPENLEATYRLPLLGVIPDSPSIARSARGGTDNRPMLTQPVAEAFNLAWAHLRFFNIDRDLNTVVIASAEAGDGKTIIARHLASAAARLGSRVLLIEVDLRHPTLAQQLGIGAGPGLADVLIGDVAVEEAIQSVELYAAQGEGADGRILSVLTAGAVLPPNPGELLESRAMHTTLEWGKWSGYDLIVIDTPPLLAVSDAFALLAEVDGVVLVGRVGHSRRDGAERLRQILASSGAPLLGVIANSSKAGVPSPYPSAGNASPHGVGKPHRVSSAEELAPAAEP